MPQLQVLTLLWPKVHICTVDQRLVASYTAVRVPSVVKGVPLLSVLGEGAGKVPLLSTNGMPFLAEAIAALIILSFLSCQKETKLCLSPPVPVSLDWSSLSDSGSCTES